MVLKRYLRVNYEEDTGTGKARLYTVLNLTSLRPSLLEQSSEIWLERVPWDYNFVKTAYLNISNNVSRHCKGTTKNIYKGMKLKKEKDDDQIKRHRSLPGSIFLDR